MRMRMRKKVFAVPRFGGAPRRPAGNG